MSKRLLMSLVAALVFATAARAQTVTATVPAGMGAHAVAVNPVTNKIYVANGNGTTVTVIDGATNGTTTVATGTAPVAIAVNPVTNQIYVANNGSPNVTVIDGATNATTTVAAGMNQRSVAVNPVTNKIYVANSGSNSVTVIDGASNATTTVATGTFPNALAVNPVTNKIYVANEVTSNMTVIDGATNATTTLTVGTNPVAVAVNPVTNQIYVSYLSVANVTVIDGATDNMTTVAVGSAPYVVVVNPVTNMIYTANNGSNTVTVIDGATKATTTVAAGMGPFSLALNPNTNQIYVANLNSNNVTVINGATNSTTTLTAGTGPQGVGVNPVTDKIYVANGGSNNVTVIDGATNTTSAVTAGTNPSTVGVNPVTNEIYVANLNSDNVTVIDGTTNTTSTVTAPVGSPYAVAVNPVTNKIYVAAANGTAVSVIDGATNTTSTITAGPTLFPNQNFETPYTVAVNPVTNQIYLANEGSNTVTVIDGATNSTSTVPAGSSPWAVAVNPVTNQIYVANEGSNTVTVIDGATNTTSTVTVGANPYAVAVNSVTNKIYVANYGDNTVTVVDGATNTTATVAAGTNPIDVTVNPVTNQIYVLNVGTLTVIDGASNSTSTVPTMNGSPSAVAVNPVTNKIYVTNYGTGTVTVIDGATDTTSTVTAGSGANGAAVNPVTNQIYVANEISNNVTVITEQQVQPIPLTTTITPLAGNQTSNPTPTFTFSATSTFAPTAPPPDALYFQFDTWQGPWIPATSTGSGSFTGTAPTLSLGTHILYAYATDGQDATSTNAGENGIGESSPLIGAISAYLFVVNNSAGPATHFLVTAPTSATAGTTVNVTVTAQDASNNTATSYTGTVHFTSSDPSAVLPADSMLTNSVGMFSATLNTAGSQTITATDTVTGSITGTSNAITVTAVGPASPTITLTAPSSVELGTGLTYLIQVTAGSTTATNLTVTDPLPGGLSATSLSSGCTGTTSITCTIASIPAGQTVSLSISVVPTATGTLMNTATLAGVGSTEPVSTDVISTGVALTVELYSANAADFVTSSPSSGDCTTAQVICETFFPSGTAVTLTANGPGFLAWSVDGSLTTCPGTGTCTVTMSSQHTVLADYGTVGFFSTAFGDGVVGVPYAVDISQGALGGTPPYTFTITSGSLPTGLALSGSVFSGTPTTTGTFSFTLNVTDKNGLTGSANTSITIISPPNVSAQLSLLNGQYAALFRGVSDADASLRDFVGSLTFDGGTTTTGTGTITSGTIDTNGNGSSPAAATISVTGTYTIGPDNRCLIFLNTAAGPFGVFTCSLGDVYQGVAYSVQFIRFDDDTGTGTRGAGLMKRQDPNAFTAASFAGTYIIGGTGEDTTFNRVTELGLLSANATVTITNLTADFNDNSVLSTIALVSGTYGTDGSNGAISPVGRTQFNLNLTQTTNGVSQPVTSNVAVYIVDANTTFSLTIDSGATNSILAGMAERQFAPAGGFTTSSITGPDVVSEEGPSGLYSSSSSQVLLGLATTSVVSGTPTVSITYDSNDDETVAIQQTASAPYAMTGSGRGTFNFGSAVPSPFLSSQVILYLSRPDHGFVMGSGADPGLGTIDLQSGGPFSLTSFAANYFFGNREPATPSGGPVDSGVASVSGNTLNFTEDASHERGTLDYGGMGSYGVAVSPLGWITFTKNSGVGAFFDVESGLIITPYRLVTADIDTSEHHPNVTDAESLTMPPGAPSPTSFTVPAFGTVSIGSSAQSAPITFTNVGDGLLSFTRVTNATDFSIAVTPGTCLTSPALILIQQSTCTVTVTFAPAATTPPGPTGNENLILQTDAGNITLTASGTVTAPLLTPTFSNLTPSQSIPAGTASITLGGTIGNGISYPAPGETVSITIGSVNQTATIGTNGAFNTTFQTANLAASTTPYPITYSYGGDGTFSAATDSSTTLTVNAPQVFYTLTVTDIGTGNGSVTDNLQQINCTTAAGVQSGTCSASYPAGTPVTLTAAATGNSTFAGWGGACSGTSSCVVTMNSAQSVTASFTPPPQQISLTFSPGTNVTGMATYDCPSNPNPTPTNPCTDPNAHALALSIPQVLQSITLTVQATELPPSMGNGICPNGDTPTQDFDCRFVTFFTYQTTSNGEVVPLCYPYANGNCVHYQVFYGTPGVEPNPSNYVGPIDWEVTWNNDAFVPPAPYAGSIPQLYDDPDYAVTPTSPYGTNCTTPMLVNGSPTNPPIYCQFEFNITTAYLPDKKVDAGITGRTKQFNDVAVAFPPANVGNLTITDAPLSATVVAGSPIGYTITVTNSAGGAVTGATLTDALPAGTNVNWTISPTYAGPGTCAITGSTGSQALSCSFGTIAASQTFTIGLLSPSSSIGTYTDTTTTIFGTQQILSIATLAVQGITATFSNLTPSQTIQAGTASITLSGAIGNGEQFPVGETVSISIGSVTQQVTIGNAGAFSTTFPTTALAASSAPYPITYTYAGDGTFTPATNSSTTLTVIGAPSQFALTVTDIGTGNGTVTDNLQQIDCTTAAGVQSGSCSANYTAGTPVTLTATPSGNTTFAGWGGACTGTTTCAVTMNSAQSVTASFAPPPQLINLTFNPGTTVTGMATYDCPSNPNPTPTNPCTDPNAHALALSIPQVLQSITLTVQATELPPSMGNGICPNGDTPTQDFDCRFVTFFTYQTNANGDKVVPLCYPYANGNCVHYQVYSGTPGVEPNPSNYVGPIDWEVSWNNDAFVPPAPYAGSIPQLYDDPDYAVTPTSPYGTNCSTPMLVNGSPTNPPIYCQFEFNITTAYLPNKKVDAGITGRTKQFNDVAVAFPPANVGNLTITDAPLATPVVAGSAIGYTITVTNSAGGAVTGATLTDILPAGTNVNWTISPTYTGPGTCAVTGAVGSQVLSCSFGTIAASQTFTIGLLSASSSIGTYTDTATTVFGTQQILSIATLAAQGITTTFSNLTPSQTTTSGTSINLAGVIGGSTSYPASGETVSISIGSVTQQATIGANGAFSTTFPTTALAASTTPYTITYSYTSDGIFTSATDTSTTLTVNPSVTSTLVISPSSINFGQVPLGGIALNAVTLKNIGKTPIAISKIAMSKTGVGDFDDFFVLSLCPSTLKAGSSCLLGVGYVPDHDDAIGAISSTSVVITDNVAGSPQSVPLQAETINPKATLSSTFLSFGSQKVGTTSAGKTVTVTSTGATPLVLNSISVTGAYILAGATTCAAGATLAPTQTCSITINFKPAKTGLQAGAVNISDNTLFGKHVILLTGTGQ